MLVSEILGESTTYLESPANIVDEIEYKILRLDLYQERYRDDIRQRPEHQHQLAILLELSKHHPIEHLSKIFDAIRRYSVSYYGRMNNSLRSGKLPSSTNLIDQYVAGAPKIQSDVVYRGLGRDAFNSLTPGEMFVDPAFVSTTGDIKTAEYFSKRKQKGGVLVIHGVAGIAVPGIRIGEDEYLLPRNSKFKVISKEGNVAHLQLVK